MINLKRADFPDGFLFGAATAAYQIEGHGFGGAGPTHWDTWSATPGNVVNAENGSVACDHYNRWESDLDLIAAAGMDAYRFSTSWARVLPQGRGAANQEGLGFYDRLVDGMLARGIKPNLTLYHWEIPAALADLGGWTNPDIADWYTDYARLIASKIGDRVEWISTFNEPWCVTWNGHFNGLHAPGIRDIRAASRATHNLLNAHTKALRALRADGQTNLGIVLNQDAVHPANDSAEAADAAARYDACLNRLIMEPVFKGRYPQELLDGLAPHLPQSFEKDLEDWLTPLDWLGVNYYSRKLVLPAETFPGFAFDAARLPTTTMDWEVYPEGLAEVLQRVSGEFSGGLPIYITENGRSTEEPATVSSVDDTDRIAYFDVHFRAARAAIEAGVPLFGYFLWSLMDNYEWARGYEKRFGIIHVDFDTQKRTPKASYHALADMIRKN